jgi:hypothetical protein
MLSEEHVGGNQQSLTWFPRKKSCTADNAQESSENTSHVVKTMFNRSLSREHLTTADRMVPLLNCTNSAACAPDGDSDEFNVIYFAQLQKAPIMKLNL